MHYTKIRSHPIRNECTLVLCADQGGGIIKLQNKKPQTPPPRQTQITDTPPPHLLWKKFWVHTRVYLNNKMLIHAGYDIAEIF